MPGEKESEMIGFYLVELAKLILSLLLPLFQVDAQIASALLPW